MWIPTEKEKYGVGKFITFLLLENCCAPLPVAGHVRYCADGGVWLIVFNWDSINAPPNSPWWELGSQLSATLQNTGIVALTSSSFPVATATFLLFFLFSYLCVCVCFALSSLCIATLQTRELCFLSSYCSACLNGGKPAWHSPSLHLSLFFCYFVICFLPNSCHLFEIDACLRKKKTI